MMRMLKGKKTLLVVSALVAFGCGVRDVQLDPDALGVGGATGSNNADAGTGGSAHLSSSVGGASSMGGGSSTGGANSSLQDAGAGSSAILTDADGGLATGGFGNVGGSTSIAGASSTGGTSGTSVLGPTKSAFATPVAGAVLKSANYTMILTVGEAPGGNLVMQSSKYKLYDGFIGVSQ